MKILENRIFSMFDYFGGHKKFFLFGFTLIFLIQYSDVNAQRDPAEYDKDAPRISQKGFHAGLYLGSYWPNNNSASLYDGYGYDFEENKNPYEQSWMYKKIIEQYGGSNNAGQTDMIAEALGVQPGDWSFDESDMPTNMRYKLAFAIGFAGRYSTDQKNAVLVNVNAGVLKAAGNFTITTRPAPGSTQVNESIRQYNISGEEQRLLLQVGFQHLFGSEKGMHFFLEGGLHATLAQFTKNEIQIENLVINLVEDYYNSVTGYTYYTGAKPVGFGFGAFGGAGLHFETNSKWNLELLYTPMLEKVNIGYNQKIGFSQMAGLRAYYMLGKKKTL